MNLNNGLHDKMLIMGYSHVGGNQHLIGLKAHSTGRKPYVFIET